MNYANFDAFKGAFRRTSSLKTMALVSAALVVSAQSANTQQLPFQTYEMAQNTFNPQAQQLQRQQQFSLIIENRSGADIDLLRVVNGSYQLVGVLQNNFGTPVNTFINDTLFFGYGGAQILSSFNVTGDPRPIQIGPELLAQAGIQLPQQQTTGLLPPRAQNPPEAQPQSNGRTRAPVSLTPNLPPPSPVDMQGAPPPDPRETVSAPPNVSKFTKLVNLPWSNAPNEATLLTFINKGTGALTADRFGNMTLNEGISASTTASAWYLAETEFPGEFRIRSVENPETAIFIGGAPGDGQLLSLGREGLNSPTGLWKKSEIGGDGLTFLIESVRFPKLFISVDNGIRLNEGRVNASGFSPRWAGLNVAELKELRGITTSRSAAFAQLDDNMQDLQLRAEAEERRQRAEQRKAEEKSRAFEARFDHLKTPTIQGGGGASNAKRFDVNGNVIENDLVARINVKLGVDKPFELEDGSYALSYIWPKGEVKNRSVSIFGADGNRYHVLLEINPEVYAIAKRGEGLTLRVRTPIRDSTGGIVINQARVRVVDENNGSNEGLTPSLKDPEGVLFIGNVTMTSSAWLSTATSVLHTAQNSVTDVGSSSDETTGFDVSSESVGGNRSSSLGTNTNSSINDYKILGTLQDASDEYSQALGRDLKIAKYTWTGCGLANVPTNRNNCVYNSPSDLWENDGSYFRDLKPVTVDFNLLETDTTFKVLEDPNKLDQWLPIKLTYEVELHTVSVDRSADDGDFEEKLGDAFVPTILAAPKLFVSPEKWNKEGLEVIVKNDIYERVPATATVRMETTLFLHIEQLKPYLK